MRILGIDPGTATIGYGAIDAEGNKAKFVAAGVVSTDKSFTDAERLRDIYRSVKVIIKKYKPELIALEKIYFSKNIKTAISVAQARGVIMLAAQDQKVKIWECSPQDVKMSVTGYGAADKKQVQHMVKVLLNLKTAPKPDDVADSLAAALAAMNRRF